MSTKPSPDAIKMLDLIDEYFNEMFKTSKYSPLFQREFFQLFKREYASAFSLLGSNDAYILGLGIIDCWDFDKNIKQIEEKVSRRIESKEEQIRFFENSMSYFETENLGGKLDNAFVTVFNETLKEIREWREANSTCVHLPFFLNKLNGNVFTDYQIIKKELLEQVQSQKNSSISSALYQQVYNWLEDSSTKKRYGIVRWNAMREKLALQGELWFSSGDINDIESAKKILSEVFYPDQEKYYKQLELWAKNEIEDKLCSSWISYFLWKGRTLPVRQVQVLKFKGDIDKGKKFLLSKYEEKLRWDEKKKQDRAFLHNSIFDTFDENYNSFQILWKGFENKYSLFPICISANVDLINYPRLSMFGDWIDGIKIMHDTIHYNIVLMDMTLSSTNRYFYSYCSKYKKNSRRFIFYSDEAFKLIKEYLVSVVPNISFNENVIGCITMLDYSSIGKPIGITSLLSYSKEDYNPTPMFLERAENNKNSISSCRLQNTLGYRVFVNAAIYHIAQKIGHTIVLPLESNVSDADFKSFMECVERNFSELSFEDIYLCHFIDSEKYPFPFYNYEYYDMFRLSKRINLFHNVQYHYSTPVFKEWLLPYAKIVNQYNNIEFDKNTQAVACSFYNYSDDKRVWIDKSDRYFLINLRTLCYLNWVSVCYKTGNIKIMSTLWLYYVLYKCCSDAYKKDKAFFSSLLYYTLIHNERIICIVIKNVLNDLHNTESKENILNYGSASIFYHLVRFYSNSFKGWGKEMSCAQLQFLNNGRIKHELLDLFKANRNCSDVIDDVDVCNISERIFDYISHLIIDDVYPHSDIINIFVNMKHFDIPDNFKYKRGPLDNYEEYNDDYSGTYAHDVMMYSNEDIDTIFDGDPNAYWNID